jgi:DNA-binding MarR family transcriptional regulator
MAPSSQSERDALVRRAVRHLRALGATVDLFTEAAAEQLGVNATDVQCLNIIHDTGSPTAGELAARTGLSSGTITAVVDRLEQAGYVQRQGDPADRRRVRLVPTAEAGRQAQRVFWPMLEAAAHAYSTYSEDELRLIVEFLERTQALLVGETRRLHATQG